MKKLILFMSIFAFTIPCAIAEPPQRKVIQAPQKPQVVRSQPRQFTRPTPQRPQRPQPPNVAKPAPEAKPLPKGFGVPIQRPQGFGKQEWQKPQPKPQAQQPRIQVRHSFGFYNYYRPINPHFRYYRAPSYYPPVIIQPPVVIQPMPIYPAPFHGFFFQFRF